MAAQQEKNAGRSQGGRYQDRINAILRAYKKAHEAA
jgi:uncharacterized protein (DUF4415 family)